LFSGLRTHIAWGLYLCNPESTYNNYASHHICIIAFLNNWFINYFFLFLFHSLLGPHRSHRFYFHISLTSYHNYAKNYCMYISGLWNRCSKNNLNFSLLDPMILPPPPNAILFNLISMNLINKDHPGLVSFW